MSIATLQSNSLVIPLQQGPFMVGILHRGRWHLTRVEKPYFDVIDMAEEAHRRSGLPVQIRDLNETILFEVNDGDRPAGKSAAQACRETVSF